MAPAAAPRQDPLTGPAEHPSHVREGRRWWVATEAAVLLGFVILAIAWTWPRLIHVRSHITDPGDGLFTSWMIPWNVHSLLHHPFQTFNANMYHPEPYPLAFADHMMGLAPIGLPFWIFTRDGILTNNATVLVLVALNGWCAYLLGREVVRSRGPAIVAGVIYGLAPYQLAHIDHTNLLANYTFPLCILFAIRVVRRRRALDAACLAGAWILATGVSWYYLIYASVSILAVVAVHVWAQRGELPWGRMALMLGTATGALLIVAAGWGIPYLRVTEAYPDAVRPLSEAEAYTPGPSDLLAAPPDNRIWGAVTERFRSRDHNEKQLFVGATPLLLAIAGTVVALRARRRDRWLPYILIIVAMLAFAAGPYQEIAGDRHQMPFYYLYRLFPPIRFMRSVGRSAILIYLSVAVLAAVALAGWRSSRTRTTACLVAAMLVVIEFWPYPRREYDAPHPPPAHRFLSEAPLEGGLVEIPTAFDRAGQMVGDSYIFQARYLAWSTVHWRSLLNGYGGFFPPSYRRMQYTIAGFPDDDSLALLRQRGVAYVVVHMSELNRFGGTPWERLTTPDGRRLLESHPNLDLVFRDAESGTDVYQLL